jgi:hypothetical protein
VLCMFIMLIHLYILHDVNKANTILCEKLGQNVHCHAGKLKDVQYNPCVHKFRRQAMCDCYQLSL